MEPKEQDIKVKICSKCKLLLPKSKFGFRKNRNNYKSNCKKCDALEARKRRQINRDNKTYKNNIFNYTDEFLKNVQKLFNEGYGQINIASILNVKHNNVVIAYKKLGLYKSNLTKNRKRKITPITSKYCKKCCKILPISCFKIYLNKKGHKKIRNLCIVHANEIYKNNQNKYLNNKNNRNKINASRRKRYHFKKKNPSFLLRERVSKSIIKMLKKNGKAKNNKSSFKYLPYSPDELKEHLQRQFEFWMSWDNYGVYDLNSWDDNDHATWTWNIDHITPHSDLSYSSMDEPNFKKCWALENLRPLSAKQNCIDGARRIRHLK